MLSETSCTVQGSSQKAVDGFNAICKIENYVTTLVACPKLYLLVAEFFDAEIRSDFAPHGAVNSAPKLLPC
jgi:hypothetical protein